MSNRARFALRHETLSLLIISLLVLQPLLFFTPIAHATSGGSGTISLTTLGTAYTQNFDSLANTPNATESNVFPVGWLIDETGSSTTRNDGNYTVGTGSDNAGDTYSFGSAAGNTERALGALRSGTLVPMLGASFTNNTGQTINELVISYTGEQWRSGDGATATADRLDFQYSTTATVINAGVYTDVNGLDFTGPQPTAPTGLLNGNLAANRVAINATITGLNITSGATFLIRWTDLDITGTDDALAIDDFSITPKKSTDPSGVGLADPNSLQPGGTTQLTVTVTPGSSPPSTGVTVSGDLTSIGGSPGQTFFDDGVNGGDDNAGDLIFSYFATVAPATPAGAKTLVTTITDAQARTASAPISLTVEPPLVSIHNIQGSGNASPYHGQMVTTTGIVTARKFNGAFIQTPDVDSNPETSEGIFVFTSSTPPATAAIGNLVKVTGTVQEFVPGGDPNQNPLTELTFASFTVLTTGNSLPAPVVLTASETTAASEVPGEPLDTLEEYEGMRVHADSLTVVAPTGGSKDENDAFSTSDGLFYAVITGVARPFREPGIAISNSVPPPNPPDVPRFDENPERLRVDSDALLTAAKLETTSGAMIANVTGVLDYGFRAYTLLPDPGLTQADVIGNISAIPAPAAAANEFTIGTFNMERFYDNVNDPGGDVALTLTAYNNRLNKASLAIRNVMNTPDIIGTVEIEKLSVLQAIAAKVNSDAIADGDPNPNYQAYLVEGNDIGGIDVGFLVKSAFVHDTTPRITVNSVVQLEQPTCDHVTPSTCYNYINPNDGQPDILNDRPPLVIDAIINHPDGPTFPVVVIVNHLRSLSDVEDPVSGNRVRTKRRAQAEFLANYIQTRQTANPNEHIVSVGDYNAFQFNDGLVDSMGTIIGTPSPANEVVLPSADLVNPDLIDLVEQVPATQQYSFSFDGNAQELDHVLITSNLFTRFEAIHYARSNTDFPESYRGDATRPERLSDHDMPIAYFSFPQADLSLSKTGSPSTVVTGSDLTYTITVTNSLDDSALSLSLSDNVPTGTTFKSLTHPNDWSCTTPDVGQTGTISCTSNEMAPGTQAVFTLVVNVDCDVANGTNISNTASVTSDTLDPDTDNNQATATTTAANPPPAITGGSATPSSLWPPNHKMVYVLVNYNVTDNCGAVNCTLSVISDEPINGIGDGDISPDWEIINAHLIRLRAERAGMLDGRTYTVTITCTDSAGNSSTKVLTVTVPKSQEN